MNGTILIEKATLTYKKICSSSVSHKKIRPGGIPGEEDLFATVADLKPQGDLADLMRHAKGENTNPLCPSMWWV